MTKSSETDSNIHPVILCGGSGSRLWPLSRQAFPKQFIELVSKRSMLQDTALLVEGGGYRDPVIVTNRDFRFLAAGQMREVGVEPSAIILEPHSRNTAAAIALAALELAESDPDACMLVLPSDHVVGDAEAFHEAVSQAHRAASSGFLVTFGMRPERPETGYGYIRQAGQPVSGESCFRVERFVEKPDRKTAEAFLADGGYHWNSGMFMFAAGHYLEELERHAPDILRACVSARAKGTRDGSFVEPDGDTFATIDNLSVDYAVMERTASAAVVVAGFAWSDVGSWTALADLGDKDDAGNVVEGENVLVDCRDTYVRASERLVAAIGLEGCVIVDTGDAVLVAAKDRVQEIKTVVERLREEGRGEADTQARVHRPWGTYEGVHHGPTHQVKHIVVNPGARLSSQYHHHRAEHWIVVSGTGEVTVDGKTRTVVENQSVFIPLGATHRLFNPCVEPLHLIEVQYGDYLGEDDIVRLDDVYGRVPLAIAG